jgi:hypothetical protein
MFYKPSYSKGAHYEIPTPYGVVLCSKSVEAEELAIFILEQQFLRHFGPSFDVEELRIACHRETASIKLYARFYTTNDIEYGPSLTFSRIISIVHMVQPPRPWTSDAVIYWSSCGANQKAEAVLTSVAQEVYWLQRGKFSVEEVVRRAASEWDRGTKARAVETICCLCDLGLNPSLSGIPEGFTQCIVQAQLSGNWAPPWEV